MKQLFSIIVPVYNASKYLGECVDSIINQTYKNIEIILINDGSTDESGKICDQYSKKDKRVKVIHKKNEGVSIARETGVKIATGEYISCIDSDDWISEDFFNFFSTIIKNNTAEIVYCSYYTVIEEKKIKHKQQIATGLYDKEKIIESIYPILIENKTGKYFIPHLWAAVFKKELYQKYQVKNVKIDIGEDNACNKCMIYHANSIYISDKALYYYRINPNSVTGGNRVYLWEGPLRIKKHFEKYINIKDYDFEEQLNRHITHCLIDVTISQFNKRENYNQIKKNIIKNLNNESYLNVIENCKYKLTTKNYWATKVLKHKNIAILWLYSKMRKLK